MSIRIPPDAGINVQAAFRDVEAELRDIRRQVADSGSGEDLTDVRNDIANLKQKPTYRTWNEVFGTLLGGDTTLDAWLGSQVGGINIAHDSLLMLWPLGDTTPPEGWALTGTGAAIVRTGYGGSGYEASAPSDTTKMKYGRFAAKVTRGSTDAKLTKTFIPAEWFPTGLQGRKVSVLVHAKSSVASQCSLLVEDGVDTTRGGFLGNRSYHTGGGVEEILFATHKFSLSATKLDLSVEVAGSGAAYFGCVTIVISDLPPRDWFPERTGYFTVVQQLRGNAVVANSINGFKFPFEFPAYFWKTRLKCGVAPVTTAITVQPIRSGVNIYATDPTIAAGATVGNRVVEGTYSCRCFSIGMLLRWNITTIGTGTPGDEVNANFTLVVSAPLLDILKF